MKRKIIASLFYNLAFYGLTLIACFGCLPALLLPRKYAMGVVHGFVHVNAFLERWILGLRYEVRGAEHLPEDGSYIIAAKHQSAYETMKLHILFNDPAIILKKELLRIPLWGWYLKKSDVIAIDRSTPDAATQSIKEGALRMQAQGRPIVIFPQGTRVGVDVSADKKPYKVGVAKIQDATKLPVIPMAMNAGMFWPRNGFWKSGGTVVFEFLPPIKAAKKREVLMKKLEKDVEEASLSLMNEARENNQTAPSRGWLYGCIALLGVLFAGYSFLWFSVAERIKESYVAELNAVSDGLKSYEAPEISGFPGKLSLFVAKENIVTDAGVIGIDALQAESWPLPRMPLEIETGFISVRSNQWLEPLVFDRFTAEMLPDLEVVQINAAQISKGDFYALLSGSIDVRDEDRPIPDLTVSLNNPQAFLTILSEMELLDNRMSLFIGSGLSALRDVETGLVTIPIYEKNDTIYAGPLPVMKYDDIQKRPLRRQRPVIAE